MSQNLTRGSGAKGTEPEEDEDGFDDVPLQHKRPFGSGIRMEPVKFVPASSPDADKAVSKPPSSGSGQSAADAYLSIVLPKSTSPSPGPPQPSRQTDTEAATVADLCDVCGLPLTSSVAASANQDPQTPPHIHAATLAHQVSMPHSHPPSALDRTRMGLAYLQSYGWDPDSRQGLGAEAQGIAVPIKAVPKDDTLGLGVKVVTTKPTDTTKGKNKQQQETKPKPKPLDAGKVRKMELESTKKTERLRRQLFGNVDLEKYLGPGRY